ncbi:MAG: hypothetical protein J7539_01655 [Niabella sp.]|nr:hypothetical protein [Niabella sp.]
MAEGTADDNHLFNQLFQDFLKTLGGAALVNDKKSQKVLGIQQMRDGVPNTSIKSHIDSFIIEGTIDGGKYGITKQLADIENNKERESISSTKAVLDKYYFYLYAPLDSFRGVLLIQSYTEETVQQPFKELIKKMFSCPDYYFDLVFNNYVPDRVVKEFTETSNLVMFKYKQIVGIGNNLRSEIDSSIEGFKVTLSIEPISSSGKVKPEGKNISALSKILGKKKFEDKPLGEKAKVFIKNNEGQAHFDINEQISSIRPTIFLKNEGVELNEKSGVPNFDQVKNVCARVLKEILAEIEEKNQLDEL